MVWAVWVVWAVWAAWISNLVSQGASFIRPLPSCHIHSHRDSLAKLSLDVIRRPCQYQDGKVYELGHGK
jgi:hypothetical protein